jgi:hypothetical protein
MHLYNIIWNTNISLCNCWVCLNVHSKKKSIENILKHQCKFRYDEAGNCRGTPELTPPNPTRLSWDFSDEKLLKSINTAHEDSQKLLNVCYFIKWLSINNNIILIPFQIFFFKIKNISEKYRI